MKLNLSYRYILILTIVVLGCCFTVSGQLTGTKNIPGDYATVTAAVTALNAAGVGSGGVTFNVAAGYTETISATISVTATGTVTNPVVFQKNPSTTGAHPLITAYTTGIATPASATQDGIWNLRGSDYITIDGIDVRDNPANISNPSTMEYGYALYKASASNGCQYVTIKNCVITLNTINNAAGTAPMVDGSSGIIVMNALYNAAITALTVTTGGANCNNKFFSNTIQNCNTGIALIGNVPASPYTIADTSNIVGGSNSAAGNLIINFGGAAAAAMGAAGIRTQNQYSLTVSYNTINNNNGNGTNHPNALRGILLGTAPGASAAVTNNSITINGGGTTQTITGIENTAGTSASNNTINLSNNTISNGTYTTATTGSFYGIINSASPATVFINNNTLANNSTATATTSTAIYCPIFNSGAATTTININSNNIGTTNLSAVNFTASNAIAQTFINNTAGGSASALSISNNNFYNVVYSVQSAGTNTFISNSAATLSQAINMNIFTNLNVNTTGSITFISNNAAVPAGGTQDVNSNSINTGFTKAPGGTVTLFTSSGTSASTAIVNQNNNDFSNITVTGGTVVAGWVNVDAGAATKTIQNNTFSNWSGGTGTITVMSVSLTNASNGTTGNVIKNISSAGAIIGITTAAGNDKIYSNTINTLLTTGASVTGISVTSGTTKNIYTNKIHDLQATNVAGIVHGISVSGNTTTGVTTANIFNNVIGDLRTPSTNQSGDAIRGINVAMSKPTTTVNVYYNTIYINASSSGAVFGTTGVYQTANATATTGTLNLRNNIIANHSTPNGTGLTVAFRRSSNALANYASTSNNNLFYAGTPGSNRLIYYDATNSSQTLVAYKAVVSPMDAQSVSEDLVTSLKFLDTLGTSASYLHLDPAKPTLAESGGAAITGFTTDYDSQIRQGNTGYSGTGTAPDIGADEFNGVHATGLLGTYNIGTGQTYSSLTNAGGLFAEINNLGLSGNIVVKITSDLVEDGSNALFQSVEQGIGGYTITIQPSASTARIISGNVLAGMIRLNGARRLIIDGSNGTTSNYFTFRNTNTAGTTGTAFTFINGASNNIIRYCNIEAVTNLTSGVILFSTSTITGGNSNNTISNCTINATVSAVSGIVGIYSGGTATSGFANSANTISNNNIINYKERGIDITATGSSGWIISGNSFYNGDVSGSITYAASTLLYAVRILGGAGYSILNNYIGGNARLAGGTQAVYSSTAGPITYQGISLTTTAAIPVSAIKGNTIANVSLSTVSTGASTTTFNAFQGIETIGSGINIGGSVTGEGNMIGSDSINGSILITTSTTAGARSNIRGILCNSSGGVIIGNQVGSIDIKNIGTTPGASNLIGIYAANATAPSSINNNIIGSNGANAAANSIRVLSTSTSTATTLSGIYLGAAVTSTVLVSGNIIRNLSHQGPGTGSITAINSSAISTAAVTITGNTISGNTATAAATAFYGIYNNGGLSSLTISNNIISGNTSSTVSGALYGIHVATSTPSPTAITINNNTFATNNNSTSTGIFAGIYNVSTTPDLSIINNTVNGNLTSTATGLFYAIWNAGAVTTTININANNIGTVGSSAITFTATNSGAQVYINNSGGGASAALSISNNIFNGISHTVAATGTNTFISSAASTLSQVINGNVFTNLTINSVSNITFLSSGATLSATGTQNVNNNTISGTFTKTGTPGAVTLFTSTTTSGSGAIINNNNNNFSNITVSGASTISGWINTDLGASVKNIQNNTFSNWTAATGAITALNVNLTGTSNASSGNTITNISSAGTIVGILTSGGNDNIYSNNINTLSTTGVGPVTGISISGGTTKNIYRNKIYGLQANNAGGTVNGILVLTTTALTATVYNNLIGDLRTPITSSTTDAIRAISITSTTGNSTVNVYFNTIYLNATSTGTNFSTSGIYHVVNATATISSLNLRNNSITNVSTFKGTGTTVAYRISGTTLNNYASTSNNNLFYAGVPSTKQLIFYDGTNSDQTLAAFKTRVSTREQLSVTENLSTKFLSITGSSAVYLHMDNLQPTIIESGAVNITDITTDFDGQTRAGNPGYSGAGSSPDIGADEVFGIELVPPTISYTPLMDTVASAGRDVPNVSITDASGINIAAGTSPRIYFKRLSDANVWLDNTPATNGWKYTEAINSVSPFTFKINYSLLYGGSPATAGSIQYFIVAQDLSTIANIGINSGSFNASPTSVALTAAAFPITGTINSYNIPFSGVYKVGLGEAFSSLTKADGLFASINIAGLMGNTTFNITSDLSEDGSNALNQWAESGVGNYTLKIKPDASTIRTISGNAPGGLIRLNGADRVTIDGSGAGSGIFLNFKNTNAAAGTGTALTFTGGATNNTIRYVDAAAVANATNAVVLFGSSAITGGNSNNLIDNCTINASVGSNVGNVAIYSAGTIGNENSTNTVSNSSIFNYRDRGLDITATGSTNWTIANNSFYNGDVADTINYPAATSLHGIRVLGGSGYGITNNFIGGHDAEASGPNVGYASTLGNLSYQGILLSTSTATPESNIKGNTISAITVTTIPTVINFAAFAGINATGSGINIGGNTAAEGNIVGSTITNGSIVVNTSTSNATFNSSVIGINCTSSAGLVNNNQVGGIDINNVGAAPAPSAFEGIYLNNATPPTQIDDNVINSIRVLATSTSSTTSLSGIVIGPAVNTAMELDGDRIENISNLSNISTGSFTGINNAAGGAAANITISNDTIQNVLTATNANAASSIYTGIASGSAATISNNIITKITLSSTGVNAQVVGMNISGAHATSVFGNIISSLSTASGKANANPETGSPGASAIIGILNSTSVANQNIYNNRLSEFTTTSTAAINVGITGMAITSSGSGNINNNRFAGFTNVATGTAPSICLIMAANGTFNVYNNTLRTGNLLNTNALKVYGIVHATSTNWNYFHNTVRVGGSSNGTGLRSTAFLLTVNSAPVLKNNIFFNIRTGAGPHYAVSNLGTPASNWPANASDYNDLYSITANTVVEWGANAGKSFGEWQTLTGGDAHSISNPISFIPSTYDLEPDSITNCNFNNAGTPITTPILIDKDINYKSRSATNPDLGAYEFNYIGFSIIVDSNSPVCAGDSLSLTVNPGIALVPSFAWRNPANAIISTEQNPTVALIPGQFKITVSDSTGCSVTDSTLAIVSQRPTASISSATSVCDSALVNLVITVTGTGTITGTLSNGDNFSGTGPTITIPLSISTTTSYSITDLADSTCTAISSDIPDTVTVVVTHKGDWLGITSNWNDPVNWCEGIVPTASTDVTIPLETSIMPIITDSATCRNLLISTGDTLTIANAGVLKIYGLLTNSGVYNDNGTTIFNGNSGQQTFSGVSVFNNLTINNANGVLLPGAIIVKANGTLLSGFLYTNHFSVSIAGNWINNASTTALTAGTGTITFNGTTPQLIGGLFTTTFNNLVIANALSRVTLAINTSVAGNVSVNSGIFDLAAFTANRTTTGGTLTVANNATLKIGGTNTFPANYASNLLIVASTVEYSGTNQAVENRTYGNLVFSSSGGAAVKTLPVTPLKITGNFSTTVGAGTSVSFVAGANIAVDGNVTIGSSTTWNGASYIDSIGGNWTNNGTFIGNTGTVIFAGVGALVSGTGVQTFNNVTVSVSGVVFSSTTITLTGNLATIESGSFSQPPGGTLIMSGTGKTISGSGIFLENLTTSGTITTAGSFNITGNLLVPTGGSLSASSGTITMSGTSKTISGAGIVAFYTLSTPGSISASMNFSIAAGLIVNGTLSASTGTATFTGTSTLSGKPNLFNVTLNGTSLQLSAGSQLGIANNFTIMSGTLDVTTSVPNTVNFNGAGPQNINPITYGNLVLSNGNTKTAVGAITTGFDLAIEPGTTFNPSSFTHSIYGNWNNNGTFLAGTSTIAFVGTATSFINGATTFNILASNTTNSSTHIILQSNISASTVNMINGEILTGSNTLTITDTRTGSGIIMGNIQRTHAFTTGVAYAFEGPDNTITFSEVSSVSSITVSVSSGLVNDFPLGGSISRQYNISVPTGSYDATLRLHYDDDELNGHNEASMALWHYDGTTWSASGKTGNSTSSNYVEQSGLTDITNRWTCSDDVNLVQWNGSVSSDWNTAANWTVVQGSGSRPPSATDIVNLGGAAFINQPLINSNVTVKNIVFGSAQPVTLTLASGGSLATRGDINGNWSGNAAHIINVNDQTLAVDGALTLSDGVVGHTIDLNIGSGTVTITGSLVQAGGANLNFTGAGTLNIYRDFNYSSGTFTPGIGTVVYNGIENQAVGWVDYNHLTINKPSGIATIDSAIHIGGDLQIASGEFDNFSNATIEGNTTIAADGILNNNSVLRLRGNWINNGVYTSIAGSSFFDGTGTQTISASTFNNLTIDKPVGSVAELTGNLLIKGDFTVRSGTFNIKTFNCDRNIQGGTLTLGATSTFIVGANNSPLNFAFGDISDSSTVIADGVGPQYIFNGVSFGNLILRNTGVKTLVSSFAVNGDLTIENGATLDGGAETLTLRGNWIDNGTFVPSASTVICSGIGKTITGNTTFNKVTLTGSYTVLNNLTFNGLLNITPTGEIRGGPTTYTTLNGDLINSGILYTLGTTTYTGNVVQTLGLINAIQTVAVTVNFNGSVEPVLNSTTPPLYGYLNINNTGGINPSVGWTVLNALNVGVDASFNGGNSTHNIEGSVTNNGTITSTGTLNFIPTTAATVDLGADFSSTGTVVFGGAGAMTLAGSAGSMHDVVISNTNAAGIAPSSSWSISNDFTVNSNAIFNAGAYSYTIGDDIYNAGIINRGTSTFTLNGTGNQEIFSASPFYNVTINNAAAPVIISTNLAVYGVLNFVTGNLQTGAYTVSISSTGSVTGAAQNTGWVNGNLTKNVAIGTNIVRTFEVGDDSNYTPVSIVLANVTTSGDLSNQTTPSDHPQLASSEFDPGKTVNRYFTISNAGTSYSSAAITFNWKPADVDPGAVTSAFQVQNYDGAKWTLLNDSIATPTSIKATGVMAFGDFAIGQVAMAVWTGLLSNDWFSAGNWSASVPLTLTNATIPADLTNYPVLTTGTGTVQNITIAPGATLTVSGATLQITGTISNDGNFIVSSGTIEMNGSSAQTIPAHAFAQNTLPNLTINNSAGVSLEDSLSVTGILLVSNGRLNTGGHLTLISSALQTALIDGSGVGEVVGNVTMQRYLASGFGYKYLSSPFHAATVSELSDDLNLGAAFPPIYRYDENQPASGWLAYTDSSGILHPTEGFTANFGSSAIAKTFSIKGIVNNHGISTPTLFNHNRPYTLGFNLVGNPYPSPIDWEASAGWNRTNIDNALYYFNNSDSSQYTGTYSTYINGISSDGVASNVIAAMQGFFVHVSNGSYPVAGSLTMNNSVRINNLVPNYHRRMSVNVPLLRLTAAFGDDKKISDPVVIYFDEHGTAAFERTMDALKLMNTDTRVPNLYAVGSDTSRLSIGAWPALADDSITIPLGLQTKQPGWISFKTTSIDRVPDDRHLFLYDAKLNAYHDLRQSSPYRLYLEQGEYANRFFIVCKSSVQAKRVAAAEEQFTAFSSGGTLYVNCTLAEGEKANLVVANMLGQVIYKEELSGSGPRAIHAKFVGGLYVVSLSSKKKVVAKKMFIGY